MKEAEIVIGGKTLTFAQSMTLRVAISSFISDMHTTGCGSDAHGVEMTRLYIARAREIEDQILRNINAQKIPESRPA